MRVAVVAPPDASPRRARLAIAHPARALRAVPRGFWTCFVMATVNACVWAVVTPTFQVPDEIVHTGYAQYLAETGRVPRPIDTQAGHINPSEELGRAASLVPFSYQGSPSWVESHDRSAQRELSGDLGRKHEAAAGAAANYPPLYYAVEAIPYKAASAGTLYDRLLAMRLFSALFAGLTAGFCFLFVRELLPGRPLAALTAGIAVAFQPLMAFVSGGVNAEAMLYAAGAALFYTVARAFRRGLTPSSGLAVGAALAVALLAKGTALGFIPGVGLALGILMLRARGAARAAAIRGALAAVAASAIPFLTWLLVSAVVYGRSGSSTTSGLASAPPGAGIREQISYVWQLYLPRLPFMDDQFPTSVLRERWFDGFVGRLGYNSYDFPTWVENIAVGIAVVLVALAIVAVLRGRSAVLRRWPELLAYGALTGAILVVVGVAIYRLTPPGLDPIVQARYLLPLLAVYAAIVALAVRAGGRRFGPAIAAAVVVIAAAHNFAAVMLSLERYYS